MARDLSVTVVVTNHMTRYRDSRKLKPALGCSCSFVPSTWLLLDISQGAGASGRRHLACLTKSPRLPTGFQEMVDIGSWGNPEQSPAYRETTYDCDVDWERERHQGPQLSCTVMSTVHCRQPLGLQRSSRAGQPSQPSAPLLETGKRV
ncbi:hypothetical protein J1605_021274 [Eschrichtius robustus]|uniref:Uncharacterized protein n=1 Tax=Eschrichtius robustus TaxID=9764 RepID=A0AB34HD05_ESCRO|nr:hypothetical protein J1605_021274 [Eschrichtius robustus]